MDKKFLQVISTRFAVHKYLVKRGFFATAYMLLRAMHKKDLKEIFEICRFWKDFANV